MVLSGAGDGTPWAIRRLLLAQLGTCAGEAQNEALWSEARRLLQEAPGIVSSWAGFDVGNRSKVFVLCTEFADESALEAFVHHPLQRGFVKRLSMVSVPEGLTITVLKTSELSCHACSDENWEWCDDGEDTWEACDDDDVANVDTPALCSSPRGVQIGDCAGCSNGSSAPATMWASNGPSLQSLAEERLGELRKRDPCVGDIVTFDEVLVRNASNYTRPEIDEYWLKECEPVDADTRRRANLAAAARSAAAREAPWLQFGRAWDDWELSVRDRDKLDTGCPALPIAMVPSMV